MKSLGSGLAYPFQGPNYGRTVPSTLAGARTSLHALPDYHRNARTSAESATAAPARWTARCPAPHGSQEVAQHR